MKKVYVVPISFSKKRKKKNSPNNSYGVSLKMEMSFGMDPLLEWKFEDAQTLTESQPKGCHLLIRGHSFQNNCGGVQFWVGKLDLNFIGEEEEEIHPPKIITR